MLDLMPRKPLSELSTVRSEMDRLWNRFLDEWPLPTAFTKGWTPSADISETKDKLIVKAELPGLEPEDIKLSLSGNMLTIEGEKKKEKEEKDEQHYSLERYCGKFQRCFRLPVEVEENKVEAKFDKGVLTINMPKTVKTPKKEIKVSKAK
jgi:HSP20 family protein